MKESQKIARRKFLKLSGISGACLALGYISFSGSDPVIVNGSAEDIPFTAINPYIFIDTNGKITIYNHRPEMGQGTYQAIPMIIAEELEVSASDIIILPAPAERSKYGDQMVVGSRSINGQFDIMRKIGASGKALFLMAAAKQWNCNVEDCYAEKGRIINRKNNQQLEYGKLVVSASKLTPPAQPVLKDISKFTIIGKSIPRQDIPSKINGTAVFGMDIQVPGMLFASVERSPVFLGKLVSFNGDKAKKIRGVKYVLKTSREVFGKQREGVAVIADNYWAASKARALLEVVWDNGDLEKLSSGNISEEYRKAKDLPAVQFVEKGNFQQAFDSGIKKIEAEYSSPYQSHSPMETMNATVYVQKDRCDFWGPTQNPNGVKSFLARQLNLDESKVDIHYTFMGGAFGRRSMTDVAEEAMHLSKQTGTPVQVVWSREDDTTQGPFRACSMNFCKGALDNNGNLVALEHKIVCQDIRNQGDGDNKASNAIAGGIHSAYAVPNFNVNGVLRKLPVPISYWRSVYHSTNCFAHESFMDELAFAAKKDPIEFRLALLKDHRRFSGVLSQVAIDSGWFKPWKKDTAKGVAIVERSGAFVAVVAEVGIVGGKIIPTRFYAAIDAGLPVNPDIIRAQTEGCIIMGIQATYNGLTIEKGRVKEKNFQTYRLPEISRSPEIFVTVIKGTDPPEGAGEGGLPPVAPALANAYFKLTQKRMRTLPFPENMS